MRQTVLPTRIHGTIAPMRGETLARRTVPAGPRSARRQDLRFGLPLTPESGGPSRHRAAQLLALGSLEIKFFDAIAADHNDPGLFRVGGVDQHLVGHFGTLDGGGRGAWRAQIARPGDATVHLIRG